MPWSFSRATCAYQSRPSCLPCILWTCSLTRAGGRECIHGRGHGRQRAAAARAVCGDHGVPARQRPQHAAAAGRLLVLQLPAGGRRVPCALPVRARPCHWTAKLARARTSGLACARYAFDRRLCSPATCVGATRMYLRAPASALHVRTCMQCSMRLHARCAPMWRECLGAPLCSGYSLRFWCCFACAVGSYMTCHIWHTCVTAHASR